MYHYTLDPDKGLLVGVHGGPADTDEDYKSNAASSSELEDASKLPADQSLIWIVVTDPGMPAPSAAMRKLMAAAWKAGKAPRFGFCLVTSSPLMTGVLTAINWLTPSSPHRPTVFRSTFEEAVKWAEQLRGAHLPELRQMEHKLRLGMTSEHRASA